MYPDMRHVVAEQGNYSTLTIKSNLLHTPYAKYVVMASYGCINVRFYIYLEVVILHYQK